MTFAIILTVLKKKVFSQSFSGVGGHFCNFILKIEGKLYYIANLVTYSFQECTSENKLYNKFVKIYIL